MIAGSAKCHLFEASVLNQLCSLPVATEAAHGAVMKVLSHTRVYVL